MVSSLKETSTDYVQVQKDQMIVGVGGLGQNIGKYRSAAYARKKYAMSPLAGYGNVDLRLTGSFQEKIKADASAEGFSVYSTDSKNSMLEQKYGKSIFTLFTEFKEDYLVFLQPVFAENIVKSLAS